MRETHRIQFVIESLRVGGAELALVHLALELQRRGHVCEVVALWPPYPLSEDLEDGGVYVRRLDQTHRWNVPQALRGMVRAMRDFRPDIVHANLFFASLYVAATRPLVPDPSRVVTFHNLGYDSYPPRTLWHRLRKQIDSQLMRRSMNGWLAVSHAVAAHYMEHLGLTAIHVIPNGIDIGAVRATAERNRSMLSTRYNLPRARPWMLCPSRFKPEKGQSLLLDALARLKARGLTPGVLFAGDGPLEDGMRRRARSLHLDSQCDFLGPVAPSDVLALMTAADVVVVPSSHEGFGLAIAEAMALGRPVVATAVGGVPEVVVGEESGLLARPGDAQSLAYQLARILTDHSLRQTLAEGASSRAKLWSIDRVADCHEEFYRTVCSLPGQPRRSTALDLSWAEPLR